jgi:hypothetical protein
MTTIKIWVIVAAMAVCLLLGLGGGWFVKGWKDGAAQTVTAQADAKQAQADATAATNTYKGMLADMVASAKDLQAKNAANTDAMLTLNTTLGKQANAINSLKTLYASLSVGNCSFNADGDELLNESYKAAFPVPTTAPAAR